MKLKSKGLVGRFVARALIRIGVGFYAAAL